jgi:nucleoside-diphosphate-sugar epimerase
MPQVLILGAGSQLTPFLSQRLARAGYTGVSISRSVPPDYPPLHPDFPWQAADLAFEHTFPSMLDGMVISIMPLWILPARVPELRAAGAKQIVAFSSTSVFVKATSPDPVERDLAVRLAAGERAIIETCLANGVSYTILRPTLIYGSGRDQNISAVSRFIKRFGFFPIAHPGLGLRQPVHADDLAQAAVAALQNPLALNQCFNLPGGETLAYRAMITRIFEALGRPPRILPLPTYILRAAMPLVRGRLSETYSPSLFLRMNQDLAFDATPAAAALGYAPRAFEP